MISEKLFEDALGIHDPWYVKGLELDMKKRSLKVEVDFHPGSRFAVEGEEGEHPARETVTKSYRHLKFFQFSCDLVVRVPRVRLPSGALRLVSPPWAGQLAGLTLLFEAWIMALSREMTFTAIAKEVGLSIHRVMAVTERYVDKAEAELDLSELTEIAVDETSTERGHHYVTLVADAVRRAVVFVTPGKDSSTLKQFTEHLTERGGDPLAIESVSIDMSKAFIKGVEDHMPNAQITFDKFHVISHASKAVDETRRSEQASDPSLKGMRWKILKSSENLTPLERAEVDALVRQVASKRTARAWLYREQLQAILQRKQPNVVNTMLRQWCTNVMRSKVDAMKRVAKMIRRHLDGIVAWSRSRQTNGFLEAINGLFQSAKRKARGYSRPSTIRMVIFLIAGKLDFSSVNPHIAPEPASA